jgi:phosphate:Na+ symporter
MESELVMKLLFHLIGGLGIFLLGMNYMKDGLQSVSSAAFKKLLHLVTSNRFMGVGVGFLLTTLVQSSSITTVMVVGLVNSELMVLKQAIGVIMGANIGTTVTGWIIAIKIGKWGLPLLGLGAFGSIFIKKEKVRYIFMALMGIGMIFFGLELMKDGFKPIRSMPEFEAWFKVFQAHDYIGVLQCALVGCVLTFIVQSSSATLGITMTLAMTGVIPFETAAALVLGENIGTTITAWLASLGAGTIAKRAAYFHIIFNLLGVFWITALFQLYIPIIDHLVPGAANGMEMVNGEETYPWVAAHIAMVHTGFNVINTIVFLPLVNVMAKLLEMLIKEKKGEKDEHFYTHLDFGIYDSPIAALEQSRHEIARMDSKVRGMFDELEQVIQSSDGPSDTAKSLFKKEDVLDHVQKEITTFITDILGETIPHKVTIEGQMQLRLADEYESISDEIVTILKLVLRLRENEGDFTDEQKQELLKVHASVVDFYGFIHQKFTKSHDHFLDVASEHNRTIMQEVRGLRSNHWARLSDSKVSPMISTTYMDIINAYRRSKDHLINIAESMCGNKLIS